jgi:hypothetical protein
MSTVPEHVFQASAEVEEHTKTVRRGLQAPAFAAIEEEVRKVPVDEILQKN